MTTAEKRPNTLAPSSNCECNGEQGELLILFYINYHGGGCSEKKCPKVLGHSSKVAELYSVSVMVFIIHRSNGCKVNYTG